ncbi:MAG: CbtA family protein [Proteobacteria bacterium]|nr:CbtA family protein [Pseudomonadota bacterium]MBI3498453.1 CbtA family protein [Pseudomonadota bacterium]
MFRRILLTALIAGTIAGLVVSLAQRARVIPLIQLAETYEEAAGAQAPSGQMIGGHGPAGVIDSHGAAAASEGDVWEPADGVERIAYTVLANTISGIGFALLLVAAFALAGRRLDWRRGLLWGLGGFAAFALAPGLGLPPAPPGAAESDLVLRQLWWLGTVAGTVLGLAVAVFAPRWPHKLAGLLLLAVPHVVGAPTAQGTALIPPGLALEFAIASLATALVFWLVLGGLAAHFFVRLAPQPGD